MGDAGVCGVVIMCVDVDNHRSTILVVLINWEVHGGGARVGGCMRVGLGWEVYCHNIYLFAWNSRIESAWYHTTAQTLATL